MSYQDDIHLNDIKRLDDAIESIDIAIGYLDSNNNDSHTYDSSIIDAIAWRAAIVGEALHHTSDELQRAHPNTQWSKAISNRNFLIHDYSKIDSKVLINTIIKDFPPLRKELSKYRDNLVEVYGESE